MACNTGALESIRAASSTTPCGCDCDVNDIIIATNYECIGASAGDTLSTFFAHLETTICNISTETVYAGSDWCAPNSNLPIPPPTATFQELIDFIAEELIPRSGNSCDCPIKNNLFFENTQGIEQCDGDGSVVFSGDVTNIDAGEQVRSLADLKISRGLSAGIAVPATAATLNLGSVTPSQINLTYRLDATSNNITVTLPELADVDGYNEHRIIILKRIDCSTAYNVTVNAFSGETIEGGGSITLQRGHSLILQGDNSDSEWSILADYTDGCATGGVVSTVGVAETSYTNTNLIGLTTADFTYFIDGIKCQSAGTNANISFNTATGQITYLVSFTAGVEKQLVIHNPI